MFNDVESSRIRGLPKYVFNEINDMKLRMRRSGIDVMDFSMGNPDGAPPPKVVDKLCESARKSKNHGYSVSKGIYNLRSAVCRWYKRRFNVDLDANSEVCVSMGSKEGYLHLVQAITNPGDVAIVPKPAYPIHYYAFIMNGANVKTFGIRYDDRFELDEDDFFCSLHKALRDSYPKPKYLVVNFPHNPTTVVTCKSFYESLVSIAKKEDFYVISDIAYAELHFGDFRSSSILEVCGGRDVAVETYTLSKSYNMAGWRVGFVVGNQKIIQSLQKIKSWTDYGIFTPLQVGATVALDDCDDFVGTVRDMYKNRVDILIKSFGDAGWEILPPRASMFVWAKIPNVCLELGSFEFSSRLLRDAHIALSPGIGFGNCGDQYVRIALIENGKRIRQAARNLKDFLRRY